MSDIMSKEQRRKTMSAIRAQSKLENMFTKRLWRHGLRFRKNVRKLCGTPDVVIQKYKVVIFVDSCFWHGCPLHFRRPKSNQEFWDKKITRNRERDKEVDKYYIEKGWNLKRIWEHEIRKDLEATVDETIEFINSAKDATKSSRVTKK
ncbi:DNA mismatch endonuclease (patch repair protein) [Planomicrobium stackebrandtii]|uniref:Very short patch repair endonuclease n=1 Tax=Planomicrobium stackebrandtii TaxID=253160 RepID=A0ABU0GVM4_9BACL|nr:very short patch repair endonuclease [Planomicrobium stackebrandtii]MDQ0429416.1 DNA mismatch endonuclease (patch repair protein) [Planomicrobium stackebrandtii]